MPLLFLILVRHKIPKLKPAFFSVFFLFCYWTNSFMKGDDGGIFTKATDSKNDKIKIKQNPGCPNKEWKCSTQTLSSQYQASLDQWLG